jgi:CBS domain containing-hemolysin-like protein
MWVISVGTGRRHAATVVPSAGWAIGSSSADPSLIAINGFSDRRVRARARAPTRLEALRRREGRRADTAAELARGLSQTLATTQVGITLASLGIGWLGEPAIASILERFFEGAVPRAYLRPIAFGVGFLAITLIRSPGDFPKAIGIRRRKMML